MIDERFIDCPVLNSGRCREDPERHQRSEPAAEDENQD
jgi:hypothetical protein